MALFFCLVTPPWIWVLLSLVSAAKYHGKRHSNYKVDHTALYSIGFSRGTCLLLRYTLVTMIIIAVTVPAITIVIFRMFEYGDSVSNGPRNETCTV